ncbi:hypothetical protein EYR41_008926 [Orbilia oligospora]|uniref:Uncharacterized protein n=1 Tax=Orbilia oligospora TaxID=2813651 RepID=A0A8H2HKK4_ORBOL|nr:hypothetical protein EYR41_008926 [Orbilia oligospora]
MPKKIANSITGVAMAQTRLTRGRAAAITAATAAGAITTAISTTATTTTITPTTTPGGGEGKGPSLQRPPSTAPRRNSRRLASAPAKPAAPSAHVPVNLASEDSDGAAEAAEGSREQEEGEKAILPIPDPKIRSDDESDVDTKPKYPRRRPTKRQKMAMGPPAGTAARLQYLMENQEWPIRVNGDKARDHYWNCLYETRVATHCFASQLPPIPSQNPAARPRAFTTTASTENPEGGQLIRVWRLRKEGGVPNELADVPCQGEKKKHPSADVEGGATDDNAELASWRGGREKRQRVC